MAAELIYGTHAVREALRGRRQVLHVWCTRRAGEQSEWLPDDAVIETSERLDRLAESGDLPDKLCPGRGVARFEGLRAK